MISLSKLLPILLVGGIGYHSKADINSDLNKTIKNTMEKFFSVKNVLITKQTMHTVLNVANLQAASGDVVRFRGRKSFNQWISQNVASKKEGLRDVSVDAWGTPYYYILNKGQLTIVSAGPDKRISTGDDLRESRILNY